MGKFRDLIPQPVSVDAGEGKSFTVHGLSLEGLSRIAMVYQNDFILLLSSAEKDGNPDYTRILLSAPNMVADIIAIASDAPDDSEEVKQLPATVQIDALHIIWQLSVPDPKKLQGWLSVVMEKAQTLSAKLKRPEAEKEIPNPPSNNLSVRSVDVSLT